MIIFEWYFQEIRYGIHKQVLYKMITAVTAFKPKEIMRLGSFIVAICAFGCHEARC